MNDIEPIEILFKEHKTIRKMIMFLKKLEQDEKKIEQMTPIYFDHIIDFFHTYADETHHGKEEKILFKKLQNRNLSVADKTLMDELIEEHKLARKLVSDLKNAKNEKKFNQIQEILSKIITLYEQHIEKENTRFFPPAFSYFSKDEIKNILREFIDVDKEMIHKKYLDVVVELEDLIS